MKAIVVADRNWAIGNRNRLLVHLSGDLKYFKQKTLGTTLVMGRKTLESLPGGKPLPGRKTIVVTSDKNYKCEGCSTVNSIEELLTAVAGEKEVFAAGGQQIYEQLLPYCESILVTKIDAEYEADTYFPNLDEMDEFQLIREDEPQREKDVEYRFTEYKRVK